MSNEDVSISIDLKTYAKDIVFAALDALSAEYVFLSSRRNDELNVIAKPRFGQELNKETVQELVFDELHNQTIRERVLSRTHNLRELIVGKALFETSVFDDDHSHFDISLYQSSDNYLLDESDIGALFESDEEK